MSMNYQTRDHTDLTKPQKRPKKPPNRISRHGKHAKHWAKTRQEWIKANPSPWICHLGISRYCPHTLTLETLTLDHLKTRSSHPDLRYDLDNLRPACYWCNSERGSRSIDKVSPEAL